MKPLLLPILIISATLISVNIHAIQSEPMGKAKVIHSIDEGQEWSQTKADSLVINKRLKESAEELIDKGTVLRFALYDLALPANNEEYAALDENAVLMITALTHNEEEIPLGRVYIKYLGNEIDLGRVLSKVSEINDSKVKFVFGNYREDSFYLFPIHLLTKDCKLVIDWAENRKDFVLERYPKDMDFDYIKKDRNPDKQNLQIDEEILKKLLEREYSVVFK